MTRTANSGALARCIPRCISLAALCVAPWLAGTSCAAESAADPDAGGTPPATLAVQISPRTMSLVTGGSQQFTGVVDSAGRAVARTLSWGATGGVIDQSGRFVAGASAGPARVWATASGASPDTILGQVSATPPVPVASVGVALANASLAPGATTSSSATPRDANGAVLTGRGVTWRSGNTAVATIDAAGLVTAVAAGSAVIRATVEGVDGTATLTVTPPPPTPVATVSVALGSASLTVGQTTQATATTRDAQGTVLPGRAVTWTSSNTAVAAVSVQGVVSAVAAGSASITATSEGRSGSATISVQAPPPPSGAGPDTIFVDRFETGTLALWQDGVDPARHRVVTTQAHGGTRALEITTANGDGGWLTRFFMPGYDSAYVSFWVRYGDEWRGGSKLLSFRGSRIDNQWSGFGNAGRCPTGTDFFSGNVVTDGGASPTAPGPLRLYTYYPAMPSSGGCWGDLGVGRGATYADATGGTPSLAPANAWHRVEYFFKLNTPGQANSEQFVWVDGRRVATWTGISLRTTTDLRLNSVQLNISGASGTQRVYFDDLVVLRGRPSGLP